jgi:hypothetical protein
MIEIVNSYYETIWIGVLGQPASTNGGFRLVPGERKTIYVPSNWVAGRIWARTGCVESGDRLICETGDCGNQKVCHVSGEVPYSGAEFTFTTQQYYDISLVDGYNIPVSIDPLGNYRKSSNDRYACGAPKCKSFNMNKCPRELVYKGKYCASACTAASKKNVMDPSSLGILSSINPAQVCCSCDCGANCGVQNSQCKFGVSPYTIDGSLAGGKCVIDHWPKPSQHFDRYDKVFKTQCPDAYSWAYDDLTSTYICNGADFRVTFG